MSDKAFCLDKDGYLKLNGRLDFTNDALPNRSGWARCHSVSQDFILNALKSILNYYRYTGFADVYGTKEALKQLGRCIFPVSQLSEQPRGWQQFRKYIKGLQLINGDGYMERFLANENNYFLKYANKIAVVLNDSILNLRYANIRWNSSVSNSFDPVSWVYVGDGFMTSNNVIEPMESKVTAHGIYFTDYTDSGRIYDMLVLINSLKRLDGFDYEFGIDVYDVITASGCVVKAVGSSNNSYRKDNRRFVPAQEDNYYIVRGGSFVKL